MRSNTARIVRSLEQPNAVTTAQPDMPPPGLVDLRLEGPLLDETQVLDAERMSVLHAEYAALRGQASVDEVRPSEPTELIQRAQPRAPRPLRFLIGGLLVVLVALVAASAARSWRSGREVAKAAEHTAPPTSRGAAPPPALPQRADPKKPAAPHLPRTALDALASGDRELARRTYEELARHEAVAGPYGAAAAILARQLKAAE